MDFSEALIQMRNGNRITRERWNNRIQMWIVIQRYLGDHVDPETSLIYQHIHGKAGKERLVIWKALQQDILAEDWKVSDQ